VRAACGLAARFGLAGEAFFAMAPNSFRLSRRA